MKYTKSIAILSFGIILFFFNACTFEQAESIEDCQLESLAVANSTNSSCGVATGVIEVETTVSPEFEGTVFYSLNGSSETTAPIFSGLSAGNYEISARVNDNCIQTISVTIDNEEGLNVSISISDSECGVATGNIEITPSGATGAVSYSLNGGNFQGNAVFENLEPGDYNIIAKDDAGCEVAQGVKIFSVIQAEDIQEIINTNCAVPSCHGGTISPDMTTLGNIENSANRIRSRTSAGSMPPAGSGFTLTPAEVEDIACWVTDL